MSEENNIENSENAADASEPQNEIERLISASEQAQTEQTEPPVNDTAAQANNINNNTNNIDVNENDVDMDMNAPPRRDNDEEDDDDIDSDDDLPILGPINNNTNVNDLINNNTQVNNDNTNVNNDPPREERKEIELNDTDTQNNSNINNNNDTGLPPRGRLPPRVISSDNEDDNNNNDNNNANGNDNDDAKTVTTCTSMLNALGNRMRHSDPNFVKEMIRIINQNRKLINDSQQTVEPNIIGRGSYKGLPYYDITDPDDRDYRIPEDQDLHPFTALHLPGVFPADTPSHAIYNWWKEEYSMFRKFLFKDPIINSSDRKGMYIYSINIFICVYII